MKKFSLILVMSWLFLTMSDTAIGGSPITYSEPTTFLYCEFRVFFPTKTQQKKAYFKDVESLIVQSVYDGESPFMSAECLPLENPRETISTFRTMLENQARNAGVHDPEITIEKTKLGVIGTYAGSRKAGGFDIKFFGKYIIGKYSILALLVREEASKFPSDKAVYFLNTVQRK
jgi:hypothetical protein